MHSKYMGREGSQQSVYIHSVLIHSLTIYTTFSVIMYIIILRLRLPLLIPKGELRYYSSKNKKKQKQNHKTKMDNTVNQ